MKIGVIDLGSNTIRLVIYNVKSFQSFRVIINDKCVVGLSSYVINDKLSDVGLEKALDVLTRQIRLAQNVGCKDIHIFATAVIRNLKNKKQVVSRLQKELDQQIDVLTGKDESRLGFIGASNSVSIKDGLLVDIGGGSTELTFIKNKKDFKNLSLNMGSVSSYAEYVGKILPLKKEQACISKAFKQCLANSQDLPTNAKGDLYGIGGSIRALAKLHARIAENDKTNKDLSFSDLNEILNLAFSDQGTFAHLVTKVAPDRVHTVVPGCIILREIMMRYKKDTITLCKYGVREGYLIELLK